MSEVEISYNDDFKACKENEEFKLLWEYPKNFTFNIPLFMKEEFLKETMENIQKELKNGETYAFVCMYYTTFFKYKEVGDSCMCKEVFSKVKKSCPQGEGIMLPYECNLCEERNIECVDHGEKKCKICVKRTVEQCFTF